MARYNQLDALRGIASLQVLASHIFLMLPIMFFANADYAALEWQNSADISQKAAFYLTYTPLHFFWFGPGAVSFFFLLSGFVLSYSISAKKGTYFQYVFKRFFRLYVPFVLIILISMLCREIFFNPHTDLAKYSDWLREMWNHRLSWKEFMEYISFQRNNYNVIVTTLWSIEVEIKISLLLPLFLYITTLLNKFVILKRIWHMMIWCAALIITHSGGAYFTNVLVYGQPVMFYIFPFITGIMLFVYSRPLIDAFQQMGKAEVWVMLIIALVLYTYRWINWKLWGIPFFVSIFAFENDVLTIAGSLFILLSFNPYVQKFLSNKYIMFSGKISYSLYLVHPVVLTIVVYSLANYLPYVALAGLIIVMSILLSALFYKYVESPINELGRNIAERLKPAAK